MFSVKKNRMSKKEALKEALDRHFKISKLGKILSPDEGQFFLSLIFGNNSESENVYAMSA